MCNAANCTATKLYNGSLFCYRHRGQIKATQVVEEKPIDIKEVEETYSSNTSTVESDDDIETPVVAEVETLVVAEVETPVVAEVETKFVNPSVFSMTCVVAVTNRLLKKAGVSKEAKDYAVADHVDLVLGCPWDTIRCYRFELDVNVRRFVWVSSKFPDLVAQFLDTCSAHKMNYHEVFLSGRRGYRFFLDLDIKMPADSVGRSLFDDSPWDSPIEDQKATKFMEYTEQYINGAYNELSTYLDSSLCTDIKLSYATRNRETDDNCVKYSIHAFTNLILPSMESCKIVAAKMIELAKETIRYNDEYEIDEVDFARVLIDSLDTAPYHNNGSLAMTGSFKGAHALKRVSEVEHVNHEVCYYHLKSNGQYEMTLNHLETKKDVPAQDFSGCDDFLKAVAEKVAGLAWSSAYDVKPIVNARGFMEVSRKDSQSYDCCICDRVHASAGANWLKIMVFKDTKTAIYGCRRSNEKMRVFYKANQSVASIANKSSDEYVVDEDALLKKLSEITKPKIQEAVICGELLKLLVQLPADLIRAKDGLTIDDIIIGLDAFTIQDTAKLLKSTMAYISNRGNYYYLAKSFQTVYFKDAPVEMMAYDNMGGKHGNSYDTMHFTIRIKNEFFKMNLKTVLTECAKGIAYRNADVIPYSPLEPIDTGSTFNLFGQHQQYNPELKVDMDLVDLFRHHIKDVLAAGDATIAEYIENWFAHLIQKPGHKTQSVLLIKGLPGCGKNVIFNIFMRFVLNVSLAMCCADMDKLFGRFNSLRLGKSLIVIDEALDSGDRRMNNKMKNVITEERQYIEKKGKDTIEVSDFSNYVILTNNDFASIIEKNDRRYVCLEASDCRRGDKQYFKMLVDKLMNLEAGKHIFHYLLRKDLSEFDTRDIPSTSYKRELSSRQADNVAKWLLSLREMWIDQDNDSAHSSDSKDWYRMYTEWCESSNERTTHSLNVFNSLMNSHGFITNVAKQKQPDGTRKSVKVRSISVGTIESNLKDFIV